MDDAEIEAKIVQMRQSAEQAGAAFREVGKMLGEFRSGLIDAGFSPDEIVPLCMQQLSLWWVSMMDNAEEGE